MKNKKPDLQQHWGKRICGWNARLKKRGASFRVDRDWICKFKNCGYCAIPIDSENAGLDHILPLSLGGADNQTNLWLVCQSCNRAKGNLLHAQFKYLMQILSHPPFDERSRNLIVRKLKLAWRVC